MHTSEDIYAAYELNTVDDIMRDVIIVIQQ